MKIYRLTQNFTSRNFANLTQKIIFVNFKFSAIKFTLNSKSTCYKIKQLSLSCFNMLALHLIVYFLNVKDKRF